MGAAPPIHAYFGRPCGRRRLNIGDCLPLRAEFPGNLPGLSRQKDGI